MIVCLVMLPPFWAPPASSGSYRVSHCTCLRYHNVNFNFTHWYVSQSVTAEAISSTLQDSVENVTQETSSINWCFGLSITGMMFVYSLLLLSTFKTVHRNSEWQNKETLARSGLKVNPTNAKIHVTLGNVLARKVSGLPDSLWTHQHS